MRRQGLTFRQWLTRRRTDSPFDKFLIAISEENDLRRYRDFVRFFHNTYKHLPAYFDRDAPMFQGNFQAALQSFTHLYDEFERQRYREEFRTAF